jgi:hypothetical protein
MALGCVLGTWRQQSPPLALERLALAAEAQELSAVVSAVNVERVHAASETTELSHDGSVIKRKSRHILTYLRVSTVARRVFYGAECPPWPTVYPPRTHRETEPVGHL